LFAVVITSSIFAAFACAALSCATAPTWIARIIAQTTTALRCQVSILFIAILLMVFELKDYRLIRIRIFTKVPGDLFRVTPYQKRFFNYQPLNTDELRPWRTPLPYRER
jgi:hypothetical protein